MSKPFSFERTLALISPVLILIVGACANIVAPEGGIKDVIPPAVVRSVPENSSTNFKGKEIQILFDEFIQLKDIGKNLLTSPPMNTPPDCKVKGRKLIIRIEDTLLENTTYNLFFGNSIADLNEGNPFPDYRFVFSTGSFVDTMQLHGEVTDALSHEPCKEANILVYQQVKDSLPYKEKPRYVGRTNADGTFRIENLGPGPFSIVALREKNNNFLFDDTQEEIGFIDSLVIPVLPEKIKADTSVKDSSIRRIAEEKLIRIFLFREKESRVRILKRQLVKARHMLLTFSSPVKDLHLETLPAKPLPAGTRLLQEFNPRRDSLSLWISGDSLPDSLIIIAGINTQPLDTLEFDLKKTDKSSRTKTRDDKPKLSYTTNASSHFDLNAQFTLKCSYPIHTFHQDAVIFREDSVIQRPSFWVDSLARTVFITHPWKESTRYDIFMPPGTITDLNGKTNDTIQLKFVTRQLKEYGKLMLTVLPPGKSQYLVQLVNDKKLVVKQQAISEKTMITWEYLQAGKYKIRIVFDQNSNGEWDPGNYLKKQLPEKVIYFSRELDIRANWELEENWLID